MEGPKYPDVHVPLSKLDGNVFNLIGETCLALRRGKVPDAEIKAFTKEASSSTYDNALQTIMRWVETS